ncbi:MAG TPA: zinc dependent phospholipase C family protein [Flavitalea sp.]|nr:zinc dependent phospholipase C family protein [Flavitalea sp.]
MKRAGCFVLLMVSFIPCFSWGFYGHQKINYCAVFLLPPEMLSFYKKHIDYLTQHAVDPDKRRYAVKEEGSRHYIDMDRYGISPYESLPRKWHDAINMFSEDSLQLHGIVPWWIQTMLQRLTRAMEEKNCLNILRLSAELGHYLADAHVPLHTSSNHNGQHTGQVGIHGFWESRVPELLAEHGWDFFIGKAEYIDTPLAFTWQRILESAAASDSVLSFEKKLNDRFSPDKKYAFEPRNGQIVRQYSRAYTIAYDRMLHHMAERRMRASIFAVASFWYTAWVNAGQPDLESCVTNFNLGMIKSEPDTLLQGGMNEHH